MRKIIALIMLMFVIVGCSSNINTNTDTINEDYKNIVKNDNPRLNVSEEERRINERKGLSLSNALEGSWLTDKEHVLTFDDFYLKQGENLFRYVVTEENENQLLISVYGLKGLLVKDKKLFDTYIIFDETRCNIQMKKVVAQLFDGNLVFQYNAVFIDRDNYALGSFNSNFFVMNEQE